MVLGQEPTAIAEMATPPTAVAPQPESFHHPLPPQTIPNHLMMTAAAPQSRMMGVPPHPLIPVQHMQQHPSYPETMGTLHTAAVYETQHPSEPLTLDQLLVELERMLSREAIMTHIDPFISNLLINAASPDLAVPVDALVHHPRFTSGSVNADMIMETAARSSILAVDRTARTVMPEVKAKRATLILRDVESSIALRDILALLSTHPKLTVNCPTDSDVVISDVTACSPEITSAQSIGSNWFLTLNDEELTQDVAWWLRTQTLGTTSVQVRIKSESTLRLDLLSHMTSRPTYQEYHQPHHSSGRPTNSRGGSQNYRRGGGWKSNNNYNNSGGPHQWNSSNQQESNSNTSTAVTAPCSYCQQQKNVKECEDETQQAATETTTTSAASTPLSSECTCRAHKGYYSTHRNSASFQNNTTEEGGEPGGRHPRRQWRGKRGGEENGRRQWRGGRDGQQRGGRAGRGGRSNSNATAGVTTNDKSNGDKIVVVVQSDFPPLAEAVKMKVCGYAGKNYRQHSMKELQAICDSMPLDAIAQPPPAVAEALGTSNRKQTAGSELNAPNGRNRAASQVFENGPRKHQWCYDALQKAADQQQAPQPQQPQQAPQPQQTQVPQPQQTEAPQPQQTPQPSLPQQPQQPQPETKVKTEEVKSPPSQTQSQPPQSQQQQPPQGADVVGVPARSSAANFWKNKADKHHFSSNESTSSQTPTSSNGRPEKQQMKSSAQKKPQQPSQQSAQPPADLGATKPNTTPTEKPKTCWSAGSAHLKKAQQSTALTFGGVTASEMSAPTQQ